MATERARAWASTMAGHDGRPARTAARAPALRLAHADSHAGVGPVPPLRREEREALEDLPPRPGRHPRRGARAAAATTRRPTRCAPASSATATGSCTPAPSAAWPARPRSSSSPTTTSAPASPTRSRWPRWPSSIARALRLNVAAHRGHRAGARLRPRPRRPRLRGRARPRTSTAGYDHAVWGADVVLDPAQPVRRDARRGPQPLVVPAGARHARGRGGQLGRPHRLRVPRLRGRGHAGPRHARRPARRWCVERCGTDRRGQLRGVHRRRWSTPPRHRAGRHASSRWPRRWPPSGPSTTSASTCARRRSSRASGSSRCCGPWSSTTPRTRPASRRGHRRRRLGAGPAGGLPGRGHLRRRA